MRANPKWVDKLTAEVFERAGRPAPRVVWRRSKYNYYSSGTYYSWDHHLAVTAGSDRTDQKLVLLHELAHALTPGHGHDERFWETAWRLYRIHKVPLRCAQKREATHRAIYRKVAREGLAESLRLLAVTHPSGVGSVAAHPKETP
jgi:hypothetical protein